MIAFTDDDCIPQPEWLAAGTRAIHDGATGVSGRVVVPLPEDPTDYERNAAGLATAEFVTANSFYQRSALEAVGGFDERFAMAWREDSDLWLTFMGRGEMLVSAEDAVVIHPLRAAPWGVSLSQQRKSQYNALLYKKHPELYRQRVQPGPPRDYYAIVGSIVGCLLGLGLRRPGHGSQPHGLGQIDGGVDRAAIARHVPPPFACRGGGGDLGIDPAACRLLAPSWRVRPPRAVSLAPIDRE